MPLFLRNLVFTLLQPGVVAGLIPYLLLETSGTVSFITRILIPGWHYIGLPFFVAGLLIMLWCIWSFGAIGRGTLSPIDRTKKLVVVGLYKYSRNPMYIGVILMLFGEAVFFKSLLLLIYTLVVFVGFHVFILLVEEPRLNREFGLEYKMYSNEVGRWIK